MSKGHLRACPGCARHVRVTEVSCPFCAEALGDAFRDSPAPVPVTARLSRAARYALGTGTLSLAAACGAASGVFPLLDAGEVGEAGASNGNDSGGSGSGSGGHDASVKVDANTFAPPYGAFPVPDAGTGENDAPAEAGFEDVSVTVPYGLPAPTP